MAISGQWLPVPGLAKTFDDLSPNPSFQGTIETFNVRIIDKEAFGPELDVKRVENEVKQFAADQGHEIVAWGEFLGEIRNRPLAYLLAFCVITQKDGETFICPIAFDGPAPFQVLSRASHTGKGPKARSVDCRIR